MFMIKKLKQMQPMSVNNKNIETKLLCTFVTIVEHITDCKHIKLKRANTSSVTVTHVIFTWKLCHTLSFL